MPTAPWISRFILMLVALTFIVGVSSYQHVFSLDYGLNLTSPESQIYWMKLFYIKMLAIFSLGGVFALYLWFSRDKDIQSLSPRVELNRFYAVFVVLVAIPMGMVTAIALLNDANVIWHLTVPDALWPQWVTPDTHFTPTHNYIFYLFLPLAFVGLVNAWIWVHTRLPDFAKRVSVLLSILSGGVLIGLPFVAVNAGEIISSSTGGIFLVFVIAIIFINAFWVECKDRMGELAQIVSAEEVKPAMQD